MNAQTYFNAQTLIEHLQISVKDNKYSLLDVRAKYMYIYFDRIFPNQFGCSVNMKKVAVMDTKGFLIKKQFVKGSFNLSANQCKTYLIKKRENDEPITNQPFTLKVVVELKKQISDSKHEYFNTIVKKPTFIELQYMGIEEYGFRVKQQQPKEQDTESSNENQTGVEYKDQNPTPDHRWV